MKQTENFIDYKSIINFFGKILGLEFGEPFSGVVFAGVEDEVGFIHKDKIPEVIVAFAGTVGFIDVFDSEVEKL